jgi:hypothetical protein
VFFFFRNGARLSAASVSLRSLCIGVMPRVVMVKYTEVQCPEQHFDLLPLVSHELTCASVKLSWLHRRVRLHDYHDAFKTGFLLSFGTGDNTFGSVPDDRWPDHKLCRLLSRERLDIIRQRCTAASTLYFPALRSSHWQGPPPPTGMRCVRRARRDSRARRHPV